MGSSLMLTVRLAELAVATLVMTWGIKFRSSFVHHSDSTSSSSPYTLQLDHLYSVLHPVLMVIGFIVLTGEAIMAHRWLAGWSRGTRKSMHLSLQATALGFGVMGIWAKFRGEWGVAANFYSLHSWMGLLCLALFFGQWVVGFTSFFHRGEGRRTRETILPWHVFVGLYTYALALATAESGLLEKLTFLKEKGRIPTRSIEASLVNGLGLGLALLGGLVVSAVLSPKPYTSKLKMTAVTTNGDGNGKVVEEAVLHLPHRQQSESVFDLEDGHGKWR